MTLPEDTTSLNWEALLALVAQLQLNLDGGCLAVETTIGGTYTELKGRLVVGADGRHSNVRKWAGFNALKEKDEHVIAALFQHPAREFTSR